MICTGNHEPPACADEHCCCICDECDGSGTYYIDGEAQKCVCAESQEPTPMCGNSHRASFSVRCTRPAGHEGKHNNGVGFMAAEWGDTWAVDTEA